MHLREAEMHLNALDVVAHKWKGKVEKVDNDLFDSTSTRRCQFYQRLTHEFFVERHFGNVYVTRKKLPKPTFVQKIQNDGRSPIKDQKLSFLYLIWNRRQEMSFDIAEKALR